MSVFIAVEPSFYAESPAKFIEVWDTYGWDSFWPSVKVTYGQPEWPSYCQWIVYEEGL